MLYKLNKKLSFEKQVVTQNENGLQNISWVLHKIIWGDIIPISSSSEFINYKTDLKVTHNIIIRYLNIIDNKMRIIYNNRIFYIKSLININESNKYYKLLCEEIM